MTRTSLRFRGAISDLSPSDRIALFERLGANDDLVRDTVGAIIDLVRREGDPALRSLAREYDGVSLAALEVEQSACDAALRALALDARRALERLARNLERVHRATLPQAFEVEPEPGVYVGGRPEALGRVGIYAPGGKAAYPTSVLMGAIPARVAGVREVIVCTPPTKAGRPSSAVLAACALGAVDHVYALGGAGAIAAMAYGTQSIKRVDSIVGPGNAYVSEAKTQVSRVVSVDAPAGPSEILVIADESADPAHVAREMVAQAEHDEQACAVAVTLSTEVAARIEASLLTQAGGAERAAIVRRSLEAAGGVLVARDLDEVVTFSSAYAPEHVLVLLRDATAVRDKIRNAGTIVEGPGSVVFGDYLTGSNHVLPTGGAARAYSGLSVQHFLRWTSVQRVTTGAASRLASDVGALADLEGLPGHARAARAWEAL